MRYVRRFGRPKAGRFRPKKSRPGRTGYRGQLARLIPERPVFVNLAGGRNYSGPMDRGNGVFRANIPVFPVFFRASMAACEIAPYIWKPATLAIRNLTGPAEQAM